MRLQLRRFNSFVFTHIPKCAGSSFRKYLCDSAINSGIEPPSIYIPECLGIPNTKNLSQLKEPELIKLQENNIKILGDHSLFNAHITYNLNIDRPFYYTILRDPIKRFISHYNYFYFERGYGNLKGVKINDLKDEQLNQLFKSMGNTMVDYVANRNPKTEPVVNESITLRAIYNLEQHFGSFGILEQMDESIQLLSRYSPPWIKFELDKFPFLNKQKNNSKAEEIDDLILDKIKEAHVHDVKLYEYAKSLFNLKAKAYLL